MANYDYVVASIEVPTGDATLPRPIVSPGTNLYGITLVTLPSGYLNGSLGRVFMHIGGADRPGVRLSREGATWVAPRDPISGEQVPEKGGIFLSCPDGLAASIKGLEFYVDLGGG